MKKKLTREDAIQEYNRRWLAGEFEGSELLKDKTMIDILSTPEFEKAIQECMEEQKNARNLYKKTVNELIKMGKYVPREKRPEIDRIQELGLLDDPAAFTEEIVKVYFKKSNLPRSAREYIQELGQQAWNLAVSRIICAADAEMAELYKIATTEEK